MESASVGAVVEAGPGVEWAMVGGTLTVLMIDQIKLDMFDSASQGPTHGSVRVAVSGRRLRTSSISCSCRRDMEVNWARRSTIKLMRV